MKIVIFNVKYSENLGDGLLATCLEDQIRVLEPEADVETIDLAGRTGYGETSSKRGHLLAIMRRFPGHVRRSVVRLILSRRMKKFCQEWEPKIAASDAVIIGGGNLLQDDDLNFPVKIASVLDIVRKHHKPLAIFSVGVSNYWSDDARDLFAKILDARLFHCSVRDALARDAFAGHFPMLTVPAVVSDPGLAASHMAGHAINVQSEHAVFGLCVTNPVILDRHASSKRGEIPLKSELEYRYLVSALADHGGDILLFCNGAREDQAFLNRVCADTEIESLRASGRVTVAPRPLEPENLIQTIRATDVVIAHRLHACIASVSLGIPAIGLDWDRKVRGFFEKINQTDHFVSSGTHPEKIAAIALRVLEEGMDQSVSDRLNRSAIEGIAGMLSDLHALLGESGYVSVPNEQGRNSRVMHHFKTLPWMRPRANNGPDLT